MLKQICLWLQIRALEATAQGQLDILPMLSDSETINRVMLAHLNALTEIDRLKSEYRKAVRGCGIRALSLGA